VQGRRRGWWPPPTLIMEVGKRWGHREQPLRDPSFNSGVNARLFGWALLVSHRRAGCHIGLLATLAGGAIPLRRVRQGKAGFNGSYGRPALPDAVSQSGHIRRGRILKAGARKGRDLARGAPSTKFELVVNLKTARGLKFGKYRRRLLAVCRRGVSRNDVADRHLRHAADVRGCQHSALGIELFWFSQN